MKRVSAGSVLAGVFLLLVGLAIGGLGPRAQVRELEARLEAAGECEGSTMGTDLANVFRGRPWDGSRPERKVTRIDPPPEPAVPEPELPPEPEDDGGLKFHFNTDGGEQSLSKEEVAEGLDLAREALALRYTQAREALVQDARPSEAQLEAIDATVERMNDDLMGLARELSAVIAEGQEPSRRDTMAFAADTLDVLLAAEDQLRGTLDAEQLAALQDESLDPLSYVDPALIDVLAPMNR